MVDTGTRPAGSNKPDRKGAALWATAVAVPVALLAGFLIFTRVLPTPGEPTAAATPVPVPSTAVDIAAPALSPAQAQVCLAVTSQLPATVRNLPARKVGAGPEQNAAYGEPPLTVACGVTRPVMCETTTPSGGCVPMDTELLTMNSVCWYAKAVPGGTAFTTLDREVPVQVTVPQAYGQPAQWANEFSDIVVKTDRSLTTGVPSGCV